jgi:hypothetical protein
MVDHAQDHAMLVELLASSIETRPEYSPLFYLFDSLLHTCARAVRFLNFLVCSALLARHQPEEAQGQPELVYGLRGILPRVLKSVFPHGLAANPKLKTLVDQWAVRAVFFTFFSLLSFTDTIDRGAPGNCSAEQTRGNHGW